jgi:hypothetical protein
VVFEIVDVVGFPIFEVRRHSWVGDEAVRRGIDVALRLPYYYIFSGDFDDDGVPATL